jgi:hypothetical protein
MSLTHLIRVRMNAERLLEERAFLAEHEKKEAK